MLIIFTNNLDFVISRDCIDCVIFLPLFTQLEKEGLRELSLKQTAS